MLFLALELWPYLLVALAIGLATGWLSGCAPRRVAIADRRARCRAGGGDAMMAFAAQVGGAAARGLRRRLRRRLLAAAQPQPAAGRIKQAGSSSPGLVPGSTSLTTEQPWMAGESRGYRLGVSRRTATEGRLRPAMTMNRRD